VSLLTFSFQKKRNPADLLDKWRLRLEQAQGRFGYLSGWKIYDLYLITPSATALFGTDIYAQQRPQAKSASVAICFKRR
jgi:hypothetical protein